MKDYKNKSNFSELLDRYRWYVGSFLLVAVIFSGGYLYWLTSGKNQARINDNRTFEALSDKIDALDNKIVVLENKINNISSSAIPNMVNTSNVESGEVAGTSVISDNKSNAPQGKINLNTATVAQLDTLPGIGPAYANRIIEYRTSNGGFKDIAEVQNIKGIGPKTFEKIKDLITI